MGRMRFVRPDTIKLELSDGDWIVVKKSLTFGESQKLSGAGLTGLKNGFASQEVGLDWEAFQIARIEIWLVEWSFCDENDKSVPVSRSSISNLDPETAAEVQKAIEEHVEALEAEKNVPPKTKLSVVKPKSEV